MDRRHWIFASAACLATLVFGVVGFAGDFNSKVSVGDVGAGFQNLDGVDGKTHSSDDYKAAKVLVLCFTCNHCPVAVAYEDRFIEFAKEYQSKDVAFVAINVNNGAADKLPAMKQRAQAKGFTFPYLYDPSQASARAYGATCTPHLFVLCAERKIAYMGAFDDSNNADRAKKHFVKDAVDSLLAGKKPAVTETRQRGCSIKYD